MLDGPLAAGGRGADVQHLALALEVDAGAGRDGLQSGRRDRAIGLAQVVPHRRVFGAHAPEGVAARAVVVADLDLVEQGRGVEEPDGVLGAIVVLVGVGRVQRIVVEADVGPQVARGLSGFVEFLGVAIDGMALLVQRPVVPVVAEGDDGARGIQLIHVVLEVRLEPVLARRRTRLAADAAPMLVVGHQHDAVGDRLEELQVVVRIGERKGDPDFPAERFQSGMGRASRCGYCARAAGERFSRSKT